MAIDKADRDKSGKSEGFGGKAIVGDSFSVSYPMDCEILFRQ